MNRNRFNRRSPQRGVTLIELVMSIAVIALATTGVMLAMSRTASTSADPMVQHQAVAIAEAYLEEAMSKEFTDPDGTNVGETRATFDNVADYNGLNNAGVRDQTDQAIAALSQYNASMQVSNSTVNGTAALLVTVTVTGPGSVSYTLSGYRTNY